MKLGRISQDGSDHFALSPDGRSWATFEALGLAARTFGDAVEAVEGATVALQQFDWDGAGVEAERVLCPVAQPGKSLAIGRNYALHAREGGNEPPANPIVFCKLQNSFIGPHDEVVVDRSLTQKLDHEVELVVVIGRRAKQIDPDRWQDYVAGYLVGNDLSARDCQARDVQYEFAKGMDTFGPLGPWMTTADEVPDAHALRLTTHVNGEKRQDSNTGEMVFDVPTLLAYITRSITLEPGDLLWTGTPHGVAKALPGQPFLKAGDVVRCEVAGLGVLENLVNDL